MSGLVLHVFARLLKRLHVMLQLIDAVAHAVFVDHIRAVFRHGVVHVALAPDQHSAVARRSYFGLAIDDRREPIRWKNAIVAGLKLRQVTRVDAAEQARQEACALSIRAMAQRTGIQELPFRRRTFLNRTRAVPCLYLLVSLWA